MSNTQELTFVYPTNIYTGRDSNWRLAAQIEGTETLERLLWLICESHELSDMHLRVDERRCLNALNRSNNTVTIRFPMKGKISSRQMKLNCVIQAVLGCLPIPDPSLNQEAMKIMRIALRVSKCLVAYTTRPNSVSQQPKTFTAVLNSVVLTKCLTAQLWENSSYVSKQLRGIGPAFSMLLASAGKTNFLLLEESHPRDLERIMNKGPPAGNVLRKQISLLPKYQLTMTPIDKDKVNIQLTLLNQAFLSDNLEQFSAGVNHKSYIIVGDSENHLLYLSSFKDTDLIKVYGGCITCIVARKHDHEHKIMAHCVSSTFAGIDVHTEFVFIEIGTSRKSIDNNENMFKDVPKLINVTEQKTRDRKRKVNKNVDVQCSKEKTKRDNSLFENIRYLKESFGKSTKKMLGNISKSIEMSNNIMKSLPPPKSTTNKKCFEPIDANDYVTQVDCDSLNKEDVFEHLEDDDQVNNILFEIENEMGKFTVAPQLEPVQEQQSPLLYGNQNKKDTEMDNRYANKIRKGHKKHGRCNFSVIDVLEKEIDGHEEDEVVIDENIEGFTNTVKFKIDTYLQNAGNIKCMYNDIKHDLQLENEKVLNIKSNTQSPTVMVGKEIIIDGSQLQKNSVIESVSSTSEEIPLPKQNIEHESQNKYLEVVTQDNVLVREKHDNCGMKNEYNEAIDFIGDSIVGTSSINNENSTTILQLPPSPVIEIDNCEVTESQIEDKLIMNKTVPAARNDTFNIGGFDSEGDIFHNTINDRQDISNSSVVHERNDLRLTLSDPSVQISNDLNKNTFCLERTKLSEIGVKNKVNEALPILDHTNKLYETNVTSLSPSTSVLDKRKNLEICSESYVTDIQYPGLRSSRENQSIFEDYTSTVPYSGFKDCSMYDNSNKIDKDRPMPKIEENASWIENICFRKTSTSTITENNGNHTIKIINKLSLNLDITKIVSTKGSTSTCETIMNEKECINPNGTSKTEPEVRGLEMDVDDRTPSEIRETLKNNSNNLATLAFSMDNMESTALEQLPQIQEQIPNQSSINKSNKVEDVLKKYSTVMKRKPNVNTSSTKQIVIDNSTMQPVDKLKRHYKITDISNLQVCLPNKIIGSEFNPLPIDTNSTENGRNNCFSDDSRSLDNISEPISPINTPLSSEIFCEINNDFKMNNKIHTPEMKSVELMNTTSSFHKPLLNPRILIESCNSNGDEDVIPPPPEFADVPRVSTYNIYRTYNNMSNAYTPSSPEHDFKIDHYDVDTDSTTTETSYISNEFPHVDKELTPKDAWTLPPENILQNQANSLLIKNQMNSVNVMRNSSNIGGTIFSNKRKAKLGQFKHERKNILHLTK